MWTPRRAAHRAPHREARQARCPGPCELAPISRQGPAGSCHPRWRAPRARRGGAGLDALLLWASRVPVRARGSLQRHQVLKSGRLPRGLQGGWATGGRQTQRKAAVRGPGQRPGELGPCELGPILGPVRMHHGCMHRCTVAGASSRTTSWVSVVHQQCMQWGGCGPTLQKSALVPRDPSCTGAHAHLGLTMERQQLKFTVTSHRTGAT